MEFMPFLKEIIVGGFYLIVISQLVVFILKLFAPKIDTKDYSLILKVEDIEKDLEKTNQRLTDIDSQVSSMLMRIDDHFKKLKEAMENKYKTKKKKNGN